jgi:hypothetical protein
MENIKFDFNMIDKTNNKTYSFKNCSRELMLKLTEDNSILEIEKIKFYGYEAYDKIEILGETFMVMKSKKTHVILIWMSFKV